MQNKLEKPQIIALVEKPVTYNLFDGKWIPCSAKYIVMGCKPDNKGIVQIYELTDSSSSLILEREKESSMKCCTFGASSLTQRHLATGSFTGKLEIWDIESMKDALYSVDAHKEVVNSLDGFGGQRVGYGAPEIVTGGRDGFVKVWDPRQKDKPVVVMEPTDIKEKRDCWAVTFGNSYNNEERIVCAGYDNGDIKMFDLKNMSVRWETNIKNGVCCIEFDRKEVEMNKMVATTLESKFYVWDLRTQHVSRGFTSLKEKAHKSTVWAVRHLPFNRDIFMTCGGNGSLCLWQYNYPDKRWRDDAEGKPVGVIGSLSLLQNVTLATQPISSFDWCTYSPDLEPCDFYLFPQVKSSFKGTRFESVEAVKEKAARFLKELTEDDFQHCFQ